MACCMGLVHFKSSSQLLAGVWRNESREYRSSIKLLICDKWMRRKRFVAVQLLFMMTDSQASMSCRRIQLLFANDNRKGFQLLRNFNLTKSTASLKRVRDTHV